MADESGFEIGGSTYPVPSLGTFNMDEAQVLYDYSGVVIEDFLTLLPESSEEEKDSYQEAIEAKLKNPALIKALMHIAYQRGNPEVKASTVKDIVGSSNAMDAIVVWIYGRTEADELPPVLTTEPEPSSPSGSVVSSTNSGVPSANDSAQPEDRPVSTGHTKSDTSPMSGRSLSVV